MKILVAEDEPISRLMTTRLLQQFGYDVVIAEDGRKAFDILSQEDGPRLALVDWMMPELDGPELCRAMREQQRDASYVYIILLTSKQNSEDVVAGLESGADDYLTKPCAPAELNARLRTGRRILELEDKLVEAREQMRYRATYDSLTGIRNRAATLSFARKILARSTYSNKPAILALCDVDHFKSINDSYGHPVGDAVLQEVARRLTECIRPSDAVGRYGGEEFLLVLSECPASALEESAERIRNAVAAIPIVVGHLSLNITISIGSILCSDCQSEELEQILTSVDAALYRAKARGRNCVEAIAAMAQA
jgi:diguanylate cyclase (GGDEF)-like protein